MKPTTELSVMQLFCEPKGLPSLNAVRIAFAQRANSVVLTLLFLGTPLISFANAALPGKLRQDAAPPAPRPPPPPSAMGALLRLMRR